MLEIHRKLSDIIFKTVRGSYGGILKVTSFFRQPKSNVGERKVNSLAAIAGHAARSPFDFDCETARRFVITQNRHLIEMKTKPESTALLISLALLFAAAAPVQTAPIKLDVDATDAPRYIPVSYTHLRAHETRHDLVCRL